MATFPTFNGWFDLTHCNGRQSCRQLPAECIADCSGPGAKDEAVAYWAKRLQFDGPAWLIRRHLKRCGAWDASQLANHDDNLERLLWLWACDCWENPGVCDYLYLDV
jgi:hypothetical protein